MIISVEAVAGGHMCRGCDGRQEKVTHRRAGPPLNIKMESYPGGEDNTKRIRLCASCVQRLFRQFLSHIPEVYR